MISNCNQKCKGNITLLLSLLLSIAFESNSTSRAAADEAISSQTPALKISASLGRDFLKPDVPNMLMVDTTVKNIGSESVTITVWTQYGWSWLSNNDHFSPGIEALKNSPAKIILRPNETFSRKVEIWIIKPLKTETFKLGFVTNADRPASGRLDHIKSKEIFWSNSIKFPTK